MGERLCLQNQESSECSSRGWKRNEQVHPSMKIRWKYRRKSVWKVTLFDFCQDLSTKWSCECSKESNNSRFSTWWAGPDCSNYRGLIQGLIHDTLHETIQQTQSLKDMLPNIFHSAFENKIMFSLEVVCWIINEISLVLYTVLFMMFSLLSNH